MAILNIWLTFLTFYDHWIQFVFIWYSFSSLGIMYQKIWQPCNTEYSDVTYVDPRQMPEIVVNLIYTTKKKHFLLLAGSVFRNL
jgi:hypothetical protein